MFIFSCTVNSQQHWEEMNAKENVLKNIEQEGCARSIASLDNSTGTIMNFITTFIIIIHYNNYDLTSVSALS